jgi:ubiquinol-cytochrome c reductase subunit 7
VTGIVGGLYSGWLLTCRHDDLLEDENPIVQEALRRLPPDESFKRAYRVRIAQQCGVTHHDLPRDQWLKPEDVLNAQQSLKRGHGG